MYSPSWSDVSPYQSQFVLGKGINVVNGENSGNMVTTGTSSCSSSSVTVSKTQTVFIALFVVQSVAVFIYWYLKHLYGGGGSSKESQGQETAAQTCNNPSPSPMHTL